MDNASDSLAEAFLRRGRCSVGRHELTGRQVRFLRTLARLDTPTMVSGVGRMAGMNRHLASLVSAELLEDGLICRKPNEMDLRVRLLELTREGRAVCDKLSKMLP